MRILILHRIPYHKIDYHLGIDHDRHDVYYIGTEKNLATIPASLPCKQLLRPGTDRASDEVIAIIKSLDITFDRVLSLSEYELLDAARVRDALGISGPGVAKVEKVRDKLLMKRLVAQAGLRVPRAIALAEFMDNPGIADWFGRTVLKPLDGASSEDVVVFDSPSAMLTALHDHRTGVYSLDDATRALATARFEIEEFVTGPILHFDGLVTDSRVAVVVGSRYVGTCLDYASGMPLGSVQIDDDPVAREWVQKVVSAVEIRDGSFHLEAIDNGGSLVFLEIANRVGGADVVDTFRMRTGIHLPSCELKLLIGEAVELRTTPDSGVRYGWFVLPGHHMPRGGCHLHGSQGFVSHPWMARWNQLAHGQPLPRHITYQATEAPAAGVIAGPSTQDLEHLLKDLFASVRIESLPLDAAA
ncbi:ATP-dependent carboxylate-amine ligase domain-containing protein [Caballeronia turbans]|uniref:ATP-grasp domain-containing protein n=1 Tax=unclassified Caballeronia TaxID=2646786 RepID=UPI00074BEB48|nr:MULTISPECIES: hypothetical protein [unclassified Caballeronia]SAL29802.1 ATP-dependent carboxylate-amine ligase domain-containing protein [Caballeronia turbans]